MITPTYQRRKIVREYKNVPLLLRKIFDIPSDEMITKFEWDKTQGRLILETLLDYNDKEDI